MTIVTRYPQAFDLTGVAVKPPRLQTLSALTGYTYRWNPQRLDPALLGTGVAAVPSQGTALDLAQATAAKRPTLNGTSAGDRWLTFDGVDDAMAAAVGVIAQPVTLQLVMRMATPGVSKTILQLAAGATPQLVANTTSVDVRAGAKVELFQVFGGAWKVLSVVMNGASSILGLGTTYGSGDAGATGISTLALGSSGASGTAFTGYDVADVVVFPGALTQAQLTANIAILAADHPTLLAA